MKKFLLLLFLLLALQTNGWSAPTLPYTSVLDNFNRANENPLSFGGRWSDTSFEIISNQLTTIPGDGNGSNLLWNPTTCIDCEEYWDIVTVLANNNDTMEVELGVQGTNNGYDITWTKLSGTDTITINSFTNFVETVLVTFNKKVANGDSIGIRKLGSILYALYRPSGGSWTILGKTSDTTYTGPFILDTFITEVTTTAWVGDNFGGGAISIANLKNGSFKNLVAN